MFHISHDCLGVTEILIRIAAQLESGLYDARAIARQRTSNPLYLILLNTALERFRKKNTPGSTRNTVREKRADAGPSDKRQLCCVWVEQDASARLATITRLQRAGSQSQAIRPGSSTLEPQASLPLQSAQGEDWHSFKLLLHQREQIRTRSISRQVATVNSSFVDTLLVCMHGNAPLFISFQPKNGAFCIGAHNI